MGAVYRILAINPGSTSTKVAAFQNDKELFKTTIEHSPSDLARFPRVVDQLDYRRQMILDELDKQGLPLDKIDAFSGRGGGLVSSEGGVYRVNQTMLEHASSGKYGGEHPASLGGIIAHELAEKYGKPAFVVNGPDTDEFCDEARICGFSDIFRASHVHALNQKEVSLRVCAEAGLEYGKAKLIVAHLGGGISITAHREGRMVDSNDIINGDGPMAPTRSGSLPAKEFMDLCMSGKWNRAEMYRRLTKDGGLVDHLGTADVREIRERAVQGDRYADLIYRALIYQIAKQIGAMAAVLQGEVDLIILTGGISRDANLVSKLKTYIGSLAPVVIRPGEYEMEALAAGALRVLRGKEEAKEYTGIPVFTNFDFLKSGLAQKA